MNVTTTDRKEDVFRAYDWKIDAGKFFDADYYSEIYPDVAQEGADLLQHFLTTGVREGRTPHPLFDIDYYLQQASNLETTGLSAWQHFMEIGAQRGLSPHPLFHVEYYLAQLRDPANPPPNPLLHYLAADPAALLSPHPLFDAAFYARQAPEAAAARQNLLTHYLRTGHKNGLQPNPFFNAEYYRSVVPGGLSPDANALVHYVQEGSRLNLRPSVAFDPEDYRARHPEAREAGVDALSHYLLASAPQAEKRVDPAPAAAAPEKTAPEKTAPAAAAPEKTAPAAVAAERTAPAAAAAERTAPAAAAAERTALAAAAAEKTAPVEDREDLAAIIEEVFDVEYYLQTNPDVAEANVDPLQHFQNFGYKENRSPHPLIDIEYYAAQVPDLAASGMSAFEHFFVVGARERLSPHPLFDSEFYASHLDHDGRSIDNLLLHYIRSGAAKKLSPHPLFDPKYYMRQRPDLNWKALDPFLHFLKTGAAENLNPHPLFDTKYYRRLAGVQGKSVNPLQHYLQKGSPAGLRPNPTFDPRYYRENYADARVSDLDPLVHYALFGQAEKRATEPKGAARLAEEAASGATAAAVERRRIAAVANAMDVDWYLSQLEDEDYEQIAEAEDPREEAALHYLARGVKQLLSPHPYFSAEFYLTHYPDVARAGADAFPHYVQYGYREGRLPHPMVKKPVNFALGDKATPIPNTLFDAPYYLAHTSPLADLGPDPFCHYLRIGVREGQAPNELFDMAYYASQAGLEVGECDLFLDYLLRGWRNFWDPHPLFSTKYAAQYGGYGSEVNPYVTFMNEPWSGRRPHPLFDLHYYRLQSKTNIGKNPLTHYLREGDAAGLSPHCLFSIPYYRDQLDEPTPKALLVHYLTEGWKKHLNTHPLFDAETFVTREELFELTAPPLLIYVETARGSAHYLFDEEYYTQQANIKTGQPALEHYVQFGGKADVPPHPLFDPRYYRAQIAELTQKSKARYKGERLKAILADLDFKPYEDNPLQHYLAVGWTYGVSPHRTFDAKFYATQTDEPIQGDPLRHYLFLGGAKTLSPHPALDLETYRNNAPDFDPEEELPYVHLRSKQQGTRSRTVESHDPDFYLANNEDLRSYNVCPVMHFIEYGVTEGRRPNAFFSTKYVFNLYPERSFSESNAVLTYLAERRFARPKLIFVGHEAGRTGAPLILLRILEYVNQVADVDCYTILGKGGELLSEYERFSHVYVMKSGLDQRFKDSTLHDEGWLKEFTDVVRTFRNNKPVAAICNSAETRAFMDGFAGEKIPVVSLIHEAADPYDAAQWATIYDSSDLVVFASEYTRGRAMKKLPRAPETFIVRGQGLLDRSFGMAGAGAAKRKIRKELKLPEDALIVLGCGTVDSRKGADHFVNVAARYFADRRDDRRVWFVWMGMVTDATTKYWGTQTAEANGFADRLLFLGPKQDPEPYYLASDVLLMTSRVDPFPCVIHEAMACRLPVVAFEGCSGAPEAFEDAGIVTPKEDVAAMTAALTELLDDDERRARLGARGRQLIDEKWDYRDYVEDLVDATQEVLNIEIPRRETSAVEAPGEGFAPLILRRGPKLVQKTIYFTSPDWGISGVNTFTEELATELNTLGFDAKILFTNGRFTASTATESLPKAPAVYLQPEAHHFRSIWDSFRKFTHERRPCIFVPNYDYIASAVSPVVADGVGIVGIAHSDDIEHYEHVYRLGLYWDHIVSVSDEIKRKIGELNPRFLATTTTIRYGVTFDEAFGRTQVERRSLRTAADPIEIVYSGRIVTKQKNILAFVRLAELLLEAKVPFRISLLGDGDQYEELKWKMAGFIEAGMVSMPGRVTPEFVREQLCDADVFCMTSDFEGLPLSMLEAMAVGVIPVVRRIESGIPEVVEHGASGFLCDKSDLKHMASVLKTLQANPQMRTSLGHQVIDAFVRHRLSRRDMAESYAEVFDRVFSLLLNRKEPKPEPMAYNAPVLGVQAPPFLQLR